MGMKQGAAQPAKLSSMELTMRRRHRRHPLAKVVGAFWLARVILRGLRY
jgi:hypothetical protein